MPSACSNGSATYCGAPQISGVLARRTAVVSSGPSAAGARGEWRSRPMAPRDNVVRKRRLVCMIGIGNLPFSPPSRLQLALELVEKPPISIVGDDLLGPQFDQARL